MPRDLIVVGFRGKRRASEVLTALRQLRSQWTVGLDDAVAVHRTDDGQLRVDQSIQQTSEQGASLGVIVGGVLGALATLPEAQITSAPSPHTNQRTASCQLTALRALPSTRSSRSPVLPPSIS